MLDESHRLTAMPDDYDQALFEKIYMETEGLRRKLSWGIDHRKFGVEKDEILQWFDVKFIHAFCQFHKKYDTSNPGNLKGYIINSLKTYQYRVMRISYKEEFDKHLGLIPVDDIIESDIIQEEYTPIREVLLETSLSYMKTILSEDAMLVLDIELNRPQWVIEYMADMGVPRHNKVPNEIIVDFLGLEKSPAVLNYIKDLQYEIQMAIANTKEYFKVNPPKLELA